MFMAEIAIILALIFLNGLFAMSELAVVSSRKARLTAMADAGSKGARAALALAEEPGRFLSTVQIGITLIGIVAGAYGGATLAQHLAAPLATIPALETFAYELAFALVVAVITYLSLIVGELVPKQLALRDPEAVAAAMARPMTALSRVASPVVALLDVSSKLLLRLLGRHEVSETTVTQEEVRLLIAEGTKSGVFEHAEKEMIDRILRLGDRGVRAIMTPRVDVAWLDVSADAQTVLKALETHRFSRYPVGRGGVDDLIGVAQSKDLLERALAGQPFELAAAVMPAPVLPDTIEALRALEVLRASPVHMALIVDEYGSFEGLVTAGDLLEAVIGEMQEEGVEAGGVVVRADGSWLIDGSSPVDELKDLLRVKELPDEEDYDTLAGFVLSQLRQVPAAGQSFMWQGYRFEVVDMDGRRVDKVLIEPPKPVADA